MFHPRVNKILILLVYSDLPVSRNLEFVIVSATGRSRYLLLTEHSYMLSRKFNQMSWIGTQPRERLTGRLDNLPQSSSNGTTDAERYDLSCLRVLLLQFLEAN